MRGDGHCVLVMCCTSSSVSLHAMISFAEAACLVHSTGQPSVQAQLLLNLGVPKSYVGVPPTHYEV